MNKPTEHTQTKTPSTDQSSSIKRRFSNAAKTYDQNSIIQAEVAEKLSNHIKHLSPNSILEIGCGTGLLSVKLARQFPHANLTITDITPEMLAITSEKLNQAQHKNKSDQERQIQVTPFNPETDLALNSPNQKYDLIISSMTIHWFENVSATLGQLQKLLTPQGQFYFTTIGENCFPEWQQALKNLKLQQGLRLPPPLPGIFETEIIKADYNSAHAFLNSLKNTGAQGPHQHYAPLSPRQLKAAMTELEKISAHASSDETNNSKRSTTVSWQIQYGKLSAV